MFYKGDIYEKFREEVVEVVDIDAGSRRTGFSQLEEAVEGKDGVAAASVSIAMNHNQTTNIE